MDIFIRLFSFLGSLRNFRRAMFSKASNEVGCSKLAFMRKRILYCNHFIIRVFRLAAL